MSSHVEVRVLKSGDELLLQHVAEDVFDGAVRHTMARDFLADEKNLLVVALDQETVVGFVSGVIYIHPDKDRELWINEVSVSFSYQRRGIATKLLREVETIASRQKCKGCWLLTEPDNVAANALYSSLPGWRGPERQVMYSIEFDDDSST